MVRIAEVVRPAPRPVWRTLLAADRGGQITQTPEWLDCISEVSSYHDASRLYRFDDGRQILLPVAARLPAPFAIAGSWPFDWGIGGPLADGPVSPAHTGAVYADLAAARLLRMTIRPGPFADPAWQDTPPAFRATEHSTQVLDLGGGFGHVWQYRFHGNVRRAVRKAERAELRVAVDRRGALVEVFHDLYRQSVRRWARQQNEPLALAWWRANRANPLRKFRAVAARLGEACTIWVASRDGEPAAAIIVLRQGEHAKYWRGAMNAELTTQTRANDLLHRLAIEDACATGCRYYHLGDSRPGSGLARFKAGFGATEYRTDAYRIERLPLTELDAGARALAKCCLRFRDR